MRLALDIPPALHQTLLGRAERCGTSLETLVVDLLSKEAVAPSTPELAMPEPVGPVGDSLDAWLAEAAANPMSAEDAKAIEDAVAWMDAADLSFAAENVARGD